MSDAKFLAPNQLLGFDDKAKKKSARDRLVDRLNAAANTLDDNQLRLAVRQVEVIGHATS